MLIKEGSANLARKYIELDVWVNKPETLTRLVAALEPANSKNVAFLKYEEYSKKVQELQAKFDSIAYVSSLKKMQESLKKDIDLAKRRADHYIDYYELMGKIEAEDIYGQEMLDELFRLHIIRK